MEVSKQRGSTVPTKQNVDSQDYVRMDYVNNQVVVLLLSQGDKTEIAGNGRAYTQASAFRLLAFYDCYFQ